MHFNVSLFNKRRLERCRTHVPINQSAHLSNSFRSPRLNVENNPSAVHSLVPLIDARDRHIQSIRDIYLYLYIDLYVLLIKGAESKKERIQGGGKKECLIKNACNERWRWWVTFSHMDSICRQAQEEEETMIGISHADTFIKMTQVIYCRGRPSVIDQYTKIRARQWSWRTNERTYACELFFRSRFLLIQSELIYHKDALIHSHHNRIFKCSL